MDWRFGFPVAARQSHFDFAAGDGDLSPLEFEARATKNPSQADDLRHDEIVSEFAGCEGLVPPRHRRTVICPNKISPTMYESPDLSQLDVVNRARSNKYDDSTAVTNSS